ncbi:hypothetical protein FBU31_006472, partial [Coemansia sp. 'formosensis']
PDGLELLDHLAQGGRLEARVGVSKLQAGSFGDARAVDAARLRLEPAVGVLVVQVGRQRRVGHAVRGQQAHPGPQQRLVDLLGQVGRVEPLGDEVDGDVLEAGLDAEQRPHRLRQPRVGGVARVGHVEDARAAPLLLPARGSQRGSSDVGDVDGADSQILCPQHRHGRCVVPAQLRHDQHWHGVLPVARPVAQRWPQHHHRRNACLQRAGFGVGVAPRQH